MVLLWEFLIFSILRRHFAIKFNGLFGIWSGFMIRDSDFPSTSTSAAAAAVAAAVVEEDFTGFY